jgi:hypothetical protein
MRKALIIPLMMVALYLLPGGTAHSEACNADIFGAFVCGAGNDAFRTIADTTSPSGKFAFAWRSSQGLPTGDELPSGDIENVLIRLADGAVLAKLGGAYWATGEMRANRYEVIAAWSPDSRAVIEVSNDRWDTYSLGYYAPDGGDKAATLDLRALIEPALKAKLPPTERENYSFRVHEDLPITLDLRGRARFTAMLYVPKAETSLDYSVRVDVMLRGGRPMARIVWMERVKAK